MSQKLNKNMIIKLIFYFIIISILFTLNQKIDNLSNGYDTLFSAKTFGYRATFAFIYYCLMIHLGNTLIYYQIKNNNKIFQCIITCLIVLLLIPPFLGEITVFKLLLLFSYPLLIVIYIFSYMIAKRTVEKTSYNYSLSRFITFFIATYIIINALSYIINYHGCCLHRIMPINLNHSLLLLLIAKIFIWDPLKEIDYSERLKKIFLNKKIVFSVLYISIIGYLNYSISLIILFLELLIALYAISYQETQNPDFAKKKITPKFSIFSVILYSLTFLIVFYNMFQNEYSSIVSYKQTLQGLSPQEINHDDIILDIFIAYIPVFIIYISTLNLLGEPLLPHKKSEKTIMSQILYIICLIILNVTSIIFPPY